MPRRRTHVQPWRARARWARSYARPAGGAHDVVDVGDAHLAFVEIELKHASPSTGPVQDDR